MVSVRQDQDGGGLTYQGQHYEATLGPIHDITQDDRNLRISFGWEPTQTCNNCSCGTPHEIPGDERVVNTVAEAVERGWLVASK